MGKDNSIYIKLEITRDKKTGQLNILTHFNNNAPNIHQDKDGVYWIPTEEERHLINDSFELMPTTDTLPSINRVEIKSIPKPTTDQTEPAKPTIETPSPQVETKPKLPEEQTPEPPKDENQEQELRSEDVEEGVMIEADDQAIENALKKHTQEKDNGMVEADEQTIIDKVLKQKKKWKKTDK